MWLATGRGVHVHTHVQFRVDRRDWGKKGSADITIGVAMVTAVALKPVLVLYNRRAGVDGRTDAGAGQKGCPGWSSGAPTPRGTPLSF